MSEAVTLDSLRKESERRYSDYPITLADGSTVVLRAPLRLSGDERNVLRGKQHTIRDLQDREDTTDQQLLDVLNDLLRVVADDTARADMLVTEIGGDLALLQTLFENYQERTQAGEVDSSVS